MLLGNLTLTDDQNHKKNQVIRWYKDKVGLSNQPVFPLIGVAGSGKTSILPYIIDELNCKNVAFCAFTGMASLVLIRKGLTASTIHRLIYTPMEIYDSTTKQKKLIHVLKDKLDEDYDMIVVDEGSMVDEKMMEDLASFNIPIIMIGDPFQLQPVGGKMNKFIMQDTFGMLSTPLRQAMDNPIIWLSNELRHGRKPSYGRHGETVNVYSKRDFPEEILINTDQIIAGKNATCADIAKLSRIKHRGITSRYPVVGDKLICSVNDWSKQIHEDNLDIYLVNGLMGTVEEIHYTEKDKTFKFNFQPTFMNEAQFKDITGCALMFDDPLCKNESYVKSNFPQYAIPRTPLYNTGSGINKFQFGDCITVYKMQGSQANHVTYIDEFLRKDIYYNHFYTAATRAEEFLDIVM